jgi:hypothetical protein
MLVYTATDLGGGLTEYIFTLDASSESSAGAFGTTSLTFTGNIQQQLAFGAVHVHDEMNANIWDANPGALYSKELDTWLYDGWSSIAPDDTNMSATSPAQPLTGQPIILSLGSGTVPVVAKDLIRIVAIGDVHWDGLFAFGAGSSATDYQTSGTATSGPPVVDPSADAFRGPDPGHDTNAYVVGAGGNIGGPPFGFKLAGAYDPGSGDPPASIKWFISGNDLPTEVELANGTLDPIITFRQLAALGALVRDPALPYNLRLDVDGTEDTGTLSIPEPTTMGLMLFGAIGMIARKKRRS